ncbi:5-(carboxyamino)imidazole ribonucleotide synthase [Neomegalonema sp.]|uniref:5-(carboxyamino)imidazole ribonucleotide synthase n=1 Tax=Neomegalonema sp. TaxID=2039713 RepID=UPI00263368AD|nr:5-(carboxyamino)imidazole ribonucleotide synthase [Neomegalonema sp.]MDD2869017.1 5-(carboxyamino)imidazole ribonucleotide synthase [Neomegalonema sp.]
MKVLAPPGGTVGILGGGQLGRMLAMAAARLGIKAHVYAPEAGSPAFDVASAVTCAPYDDRAALAAFAASVSAATTEFENVPAQTLALLGESVPVRPGARAVAIAQDRMLEKDFVNRVGVPTAPYRKVDSLEDLRKALAELGAPAILKTRRFGYDGKGQVRIRAPEEAAAAFAEMKGAQAILEGFVPFSREVSLVAARGADGEIRAYDLTENRHEAGILRESRVPARGGAELSAVAADMARRILEGLDYVGVMGIEFFALGDGRLLVNEIAPRVHNTGHWTIEACAVSQFEQQIRAVAGWPLGDPSRHADATMTNLIGQEAEAWEEYARQPNTAVHLYGKAEARPGRKMGHVTRVTRI